MSSDGKFQNWLQRYAGNSGKTWQELIDEAIAQGQSSATGITAFAGGGQGSATQLTADFNEVTTVATAGDSVKLKAAAANEVQIVKNDGANNLAVFPATGDKINDGGVNASITLAPGSLVVFRAIDALNWETSDQTGQFNTLLVNNISEKTANSGITFDNEIIQTEPGRVSLGTAISAFAGGGQASATQLTEGYNNITTVATAADSVKLPAAVEGLSLVVKNSGANSMDLYPATGDQINALAINSPIKVPSGTEILLVAIDGTTWKACEKVSVDDGTVALPGFSFRDAPGTGLYRISATQVGFAVAGVLKGGFDANGLFTGTISEQVVDAGVTVDGLLIKDGGATANSQIAAFYPQAAQDNIAAGTGGAIPVTNYLTTINTDGTDDAFTLANGTQIGQMKKIQLVADGGGNGVVTPATPFAGGTTATFDDAADYLILQWSGTAWVVIENSGVTIA